MKKATCCGEAFIIYNTYESITHFLTLTLTLVAIALQVFIDDCRLGSSSKHFSIRSDLVMKGVRHVHQ